MAATITPEQVAKLSIDERLKLIEMIVESIAKDTADEPSPEWHRDVVRERLKRMDEKPHRGIPADDALASLGRRQR
jgi:putative addiction module component (TIGR02574 family)